ncbi:MAG: cadherin-like beta sandwich domain-containing protein [Thermoplasmata archaeon]|nr:cadherin-like beta sandwich domain-containing protein [Thermoplasmata archaeon]
MFKRVTLVIIMAVALLITGCDIGGSNDSSTGGISPIAILLSIIQSFSKANSENVNLSNLELSAGTIVYNPEITTYDVEVPTDVTSMTVTPYAAASNATIIINEIETESGQPSVSIPISNGNNIISIAVIAPGGQTAKVYTLSVRRAAPLSTNANLAWLSLSTGTISPAFDQNVTSYSCEVDNSVSSITVFSVSAGNGAEITINGSEVPSFAPSDPISLNVGQNSILVHVLAQDGIAAKSYTIVVTRLQEPSNNANLANVIMSAGVLSPAFNAGVISYTCEVDNSVSSIIITPAAESANAQIKINNESVVSGSASNPISLIEGKNQISIQVIAENVTNTKIYMIEVTRLEGASTNLLLSNITVSQGVLSPAFNSNTTGYTVEVNYDINEITVTPTTAGIGSIITVNGETVVSGTSSTPIPLAVGMNIVTIDVTDQAGTGVKTYTVVVLRVHASYNANLANLLLSNGTLSPLFNENVTSYNAEVPFSTNSVTLTPTAAGNGASITVNGISVVSGTASQPIDLVVGQNTITIHVVSQNSKIEKTYYIVIDRVEVSTNADLSGLSISSGTLSPSFNANTLIYAVEVPNSVETIVFTPTVAGIGAMITVNGISVPSGISSSPILLSEGENINTIAVTAEDGVSQKTYSVTVKRLPKPSSNAKLAGLSLSSGTLSPVFNPDTLDYTSEVSCQQSTITVTPTSAGINAAIMVNGNPVISGTASNPISLNVGNNLIQVVVTSEDGSTILTYKITVNRIQGSTNADLAGVTLSYGTLSPEFNKDLLEYQTRIPVESDTITVTPTGAGLNSVITVNGQIVISGVASPPINIAPGNSSINIIVTAEDGITQKTYVIIAHKLNLDAWVIKLSKKLVTIASSEDGIKLAGAMNGYIYTSIDGGEHWIERQNVGSRNWSSITISNDGTRIVASVNGGYVYTSIDGGETWIERTNAGNRNWSSITSSSDGMKIAAANGNNGYIYTSADGGETWVERTNLGQHNWVSTDSSADGMKLIAAAYSDKIYISIDGGENWEAQDELSNRAWSSVAITPDGTKMAATEFLGYIYISLNSAISWTEQTESGVRRWKSITLSSDGFKFAAVPDYGYIYTSLDGGFTWVEHNKLGSKSWNSITSSSGWSKLVLAGPSLYISQ